MPKKPESSKYAIGEWYGRAFSEMSRDDRLKLVDPAKSPKLTMTCPFKTGDIFKDTKCSKRGGVCGLQLIEPTGGGSGQVAESEKTSLRVTCPSRFAEDGRIFKWIGETILGDTKPEVIGEVGFLESLHEDDDSDVGRIDNILVTHRRGYMEWCAMEVQAVYFSGPSMNDYFNVVRDHAEDGIPFPKKSRRPDYRSSGPKRLMPQLQIKVPTLRRWGKKMAVVVDENFYASLGEMEPKEDISNGDIVWFIVKFAVTDTGQFRLTPKTFINTTLEDSVIGLTAGNPTSLGKFEDKIREKLNRDQALPSL